MRKFLVVLLLVGGFTLGVQAQNQPAPRQKPPVTLKVGDPTPGLKADKWLQGDEITSFQAGKIYVVEFWATWCGPCIVMMPHMADLQAEYKNKGVTFIGFSSKDPNNNEEKVTNFVKKRGPTLKYTFAYANTRETNNAWMQAAGQTGIPCCFVVDQNSKIAYIGHPMYLDVVLPKVVAGSWKVQQSNEELDEIEKEVSAVFQASRNPNPEAALKTMTDFEAKHPALANIPYFVAPKLNLLLKTKQTKKAQQFAQAVVTKATKQQDPLALRSVSTALRTGTKDNTQLLALALKAAQSAVEFAGDSDPMMLINLADTYFVAGKKDQARETAEKALKAAEGESPALKNYVKQQADKFLDK